MASLSGKEKADFLRSLADLIDSAVDELVEIMPKETGLPEGRVRGEAGRTSGQLRMFGKLVEEGSWVDARIDRANPDRQPLPKPDLRAMLRPVGPVAVFCASNFPLAFSVAGGDVASAWAAGCPVIVKAHHAHPGTALLVGELITTAVQKCGLPEGAFSLLFGEGRKTGQALVKNPIIRAVGFTGSRSGGRALFDLASQRRDPIPVFAEMSSINPIFLLPELTQDEFDKIADGLFVSATMGVGQFCTNPGIVFYQEGVPGNNFRNSFVEKMKKFEPATMLHRGIRNSYGQEIEKISNGEVVKVLLGSDDNKGEGGCDAMPCVLETSVNHFLNDSNLAQEIFGPATLLVSYRDRDDLLRVADQLEGQLTASLFGHAENLDEHEGLIDILETKAGRLLFNQFPTGVEVCESIVHGGPYPATTDSRSTSVGTGAILRFARPVCYQGFPGDFLPPELKNENPNKINRKEN
jgi:NADP-dependent aldehyde dehydrogenase